MLVSTVDAEIQNLRDELLHARLVPAGIGFPQQLLDKVCGEQETVLLEDALACATRSCWHRLPSAAP